ncbi:MAG TPA: sulfotransferase family 2 domain-containing protein [Burkholderiales bacterium]
MGGHVISWHHRCIFVHIPKTGGTSIENLIWPGPRTTGDLWMGFVDKYRNQYQTGGLQHLLATQIRMEVGSKVFADFYKFSFVRNPWDKAVSQFSSMASRDDLRGFIGMKKGDSFKTYADLITRKKHVQWEPQVNFLRDSNGDLLVDYVGRYETFSESVHHVLKALGIKIDAIPHENASRRGPYPDYYDDESREMIASLYAADIEAFGYSFGEKVGPLVNLAPSR